MVNEQSSGGYRGHDPMPKEKAHELIKKYKDHKLKKGDMAFTRFDPAILKFVFGEDADRDKISEVKFFCGGYEKDKDLIPIIIMQVQYKTEGLMVTYKYYSGSGEVCPPPNQPPCDQQIESPQ